MLADIRDFPRGTKLIPAGNKGGTVCITLI